MSRNSSQGSSRGMSPLIIPSAVIGIVLVFVIGYFMYSTKSTEIRNDGYGTGKNPEVVVSLDKDGVATLGLPGVQKVVDVFEDPLCPYCGEMERKFGQEIARGIDDGKFAVRYHLMNFLNSMSASKDYSTRAIAATQCVAAFGTGVNYAAFHAKLYSPDIQPEENGDKDYTNAQLSALARSSGASEEAVKCIADGARVTDAERAAEASSRALQASGAKGTPSAFLNGKRLDLQDDLWVVNLENS